ncbi:3-phosphoshikimate 1-carboxyvinyltransferase [Kytococcus sedentarius]|uniref:3-phosphoshikimate 1-carboxyvinyltransferase n=1 Tax=Kytococcus sedentarius TaxID=1276 RepID=UPI001950B04F|nr:3-phosphoshikimate 1-carboxyvinyltransferase [Kytococcus sedentarius]QRO86732.1 3-phosphoshikimate 1-carboxyvinyltransferase [Kytococcus sedentarius]
MSSNPTGREDHTGGTSRPAAYPAPTTTGPLHATVRVPGSKSWTNRWLTLAALASGPSTLHSPLDARDTRLMAGALRAFGHEVRSDAGSTGAAWRVTPAHGWHAPAEPIDCGLAGTVLRFLVPLASLAHGPVTFTGDERLGHRPLEPLLDAVRSLGLTITAGVGGPVRPAPGAHGDGDSPAGSSVLPLLVAGALHPSDPDDVTVEVDASASSQFVSALLLAGCTVHAGLTVRVIGTVPSRPHIDMTCDALRRVGVVAEQRDESTWWVEGKRPDPFEVTVEPDLSSAAVFAAAAAVAGGTVTLPGWPRSTTQAGDTIRDLLTRMGARCELTDAGLRVTGGELHGIEADLSAAGELTPVVAATAALADSPSRLTGIGHLRGHETDRLAALATEINALGGEVRELPDGLEITPRPLHGGSFATYHDHRLAMAGALLGLRVPGIEVQDIATTAKTVPGFDRLWGAMLEGDA